LSVSPNPFNPRTTLSFNLDDPGAVILTIHDARGRLVRELWAGEAPAGGHALVWDGRDDGNRAVAAGVYVSRLRVDGRESGQAKLCLVR
jgi:flagellar hook assembly protein FlgD